MLRKIAYVPSRFGYFIGTYPLLTTGVTLTLSLSILLVFILKPFIIETDIRHGFVYRSSRSVLEFQVEISLTFTFISANSCSIFSFHSIF